MIFNTANINWPNEEIDHMMTNPIKWYNGEKIVGILYADHYGINKTEEQKIKEKNLCKDHENLVVGIITGNIDLVKKALEPGNIVDKYFSKYFAKYLVKVIVENEKGQRRMGHFFPLVEAKNTKNKAIIDYMQDCFKGQPDHIELRPPMVGDKLPIGLNLGSIGTISGGTNYEMPSFDNTLNTNCENWPNEEIDHMMTNPIKWYNGEKIVGILYADHYGINKTEEQKIKEKNLCKDHENLVVGIITCNIDLVKKALEPGNIVDKYFSKYFAKYLVKVIVENEKGQRRMVPFSPLLEAKQYKNEAIIGYIQDYYKSHPDHIELRPSLGQFN